MEITIDPDAGFCSGVRKAIEKAERVLKAEGKLYCLGEIVHNDAEIHRLEKMGLVIIGYEEFKKLKNCKVLIRAHGEPPETYMIAADRNITLIDASCQIVLGVQKKIDTEFRDHQFVIFGKKDHPEVRGLNGQIGNKAIIVNDMNEIGKINFKKPVVLYSQTTRGKTAYESLKSAISLRLKESTAGTTPSLIAYNTICSQVSGRDENLRAFASQHDVIIFVSGRQSANGKHLFNVSKSVNPKTYMVSETTDVNPEWLKNCRSLGISGATSTPEWLIEKIASLISGFSDL